MESSDLQQQQNSSGLTRYRSAPSSYFANIIDREFYEHIFNKPSSPETERIFSKFINSLRDDDPLPQNHNQNQNPPAAAAVKEEVLSHHQRHTLPSEQVVQLQQQQNNNYAPAGPHHGFYQSSARPPLPNQGGGGGGGGGGARSNLVRHSSSPAGLFSQIHIENGYVRMRGMGTLGGAVNSTVEEAKFSSSGSAATATRRLKNAPNYSSGGGRLMSSIAEIGDRDNDNDGDDNPEFDAFGESQGNEFMTTGFAHWDDNVSMVNDNVAASIKRFTNDDARPFSGLNAAETQNEGRGQGSAPLSHQLSLPNTSSEMAAIEKFLQFSDSVPCKIRAKRGCATHPRSIAERVRRTKISERMRKLQDLVPNMDKQTNTADMLDLAVDYIKDLQNQVQTLSDCHSRCTCSPKAQLQ